MEINNYSHLSHDELVALLNNKDETIHKLQVQVNKAQDPVEVNFT